MLKKSMILMMSLHRRGDSDIFLMIYDCRSVLTFKKLSVKPFMNTAIVFPCIFRRYCFFSGLSKDL